MRNAVHSLNAIRDEYAPKGVQFLMLNANLQDDRENVREEAVAFSIDYPILIDETQLVAESLDLHRTAEALVINPKTWHILYRGPIDDRLNYEAQKPSASNHYLADALLAHLKAEISRRQIRCITRLPDCSARQRPRTTQTDLLCRTGSAHSAKQMRALSPNRRHSTL